MSLLNLNLNYKNIDLNSILNYNSVGVLRYYDSYENSLLWLTNKNYNNNTYNLNNILKLIKPNFLSRLNTINYSH